MVEIIFVVAVSVVATIAMVANQYTGRTYSNFLKKLEEE